MSRRFPLAPFAFAADNHFRKSLEPSALRNFWIGDEPVSELTELMSRNFPISNSIK